MNDPRDDAPTTGGDLPEEDAPLQHEMLVHRAVSGEASEDDWDALEAAAVTRPELWESVVRELRVHAALQRSVDAALELADRVDLPAAPVVSSGWRRAALSLGGWAAAVLVVAAWFGQQRRIATEPAPNVVSVSEEATAPASPADGDATSGAPTSSPAGSPDGPPARGPNSPSSPTPGAEFVQDLPLQVLATRPLQGGRSVEVLYVRSVVERVRVDRVVGLALDERGRAKEVSLSTARVHPVERF